MSIRISREKCVGCGRCYRVCPGSLIDMDEGKRAFICREKDCWACASCVKACGAGAIELYLGADIGGKGTTLVTKSEGSRIDWIFRKGDAVAARITTDAKVSNNY